MFEFLKRKPGQRHASDRSFLTNLIGGRVPESVNTNADVPAYASEGYRLNPIIYSCIRTLAMSVSEPTLKVLTATKDDPILNTPVSGDKLAVLLANPNEHQDQYDFFEMMLTHLYVAGNAFVHKLRPATGGPPAALQLLRPDLMGLVPGTTREEGPIKHYTIMTNGKPEPIRTSEIIHFKLPDALDSFWGLSPVAVLARYGDIDTQSAEFLRSYFLNRGVPAGLLTFDSPMVDEERERVRDLWKTQFNNIDGWHNIGVIDARVEYRPVSNGLQDVDMDVITNQTETRICGTFGVPPILISALSGIAHATFSNVEESRKLFWLNTATPLFQRLQRKLTKELAQKEFGNDRAITFDLSSVAALQENKGEIRKMALQGWNVGLFTRGQASDLLGVQAPPNAALDVVKIIPGTVVLPVSQEATAVTAFGPGGTQTSLPPTKEKHNLSDLGTIEQQLAPVFERVFDIFTESELDFDQAVDTEELSLLEVDMQPAMKSLEAPLRTMATRISFEMNTVIVPDVEPLLIALADRMQQLQQAVFKFILENDKIVHKAWVLRRALGMGVTGIDLLVKVERKLTIDGRTDDEINAALDHTRGVLITERRDMFAIAESMAVVAAIKGQILLQGA